jgi:hypothetical protein
MTRFDALSPGLWRRWPRRSFGDPAASGTHEDLLSQPGTYGALWNVQQVG